MEFNLSFSNTENWTLIYKKKKKNSSKNPTCTPKKPKYMKTCQQDCLNTIEGDLTVTLSLSNPHFPKYKMQKAL